MALVDVDVVDDATTPAFLALLPAPLVVFLTVAAVACRVLPLAISEYSMIVVRRQALRNANDRFASCPEANC